MSKKIKQPWPTQAAMSQVYERNLWGGNPTEFYSGDGSHNINLVAPYIQAVSNFLSGFKPLLSVCDLGCGDFNVGKQLLPFTRKYVAVDIVPDLIGRNMTLFKNEKLEFKHLDISKDELPKADCAIVRQVLQHLSNAEIENVLIKLKKYKYVLLTEHIPEADFVPNIDIISGQGIRLKKHSGVAILAAPFLTKVKACKDLLSISLEGNQGKIVTTLYVMF
ncbi:class I SAM-dependent methyltransferase [Formosa sp. A9]|uniref:class I SAM-dependent methyltransferase n=1 Tax=Formosa sp. A9 TaxID=3442641 RepID=UPI003EBD3AFC